jgi:3-oxoacyl-[acyl-carrier protein] reductase
MKLDNRVAVVTGSSRGIGKAIAETFGREGARIVINYVQNSEGANDVAEKIKILGSDAIVVAADVSRQGEAQKLIDETIRTFGRLDILVNNAAVLIGGTILDTKEEDWDRSMAVNLKGSFNCTQAAARVMTQQRYGKIINISSISALGCAPGGELAYGCSKAGLIHLTRVAALDLGAYGINVNCIAPGWTVTDMTIRNAGSEDKFVKIKEMKAKQAVMGTVGNPQDIANLALFLASEESNFITGQVVVADGGRQDFLSHA